MIKKQQELICKFCSTRYQRWYYYDSPEHGFETEAFIRDCCEPCWYERTNIHRDAVKQ